MRRKITALSILLVFAACLAPAIAAPTKQPTKKPAVQKKVVSAVCPVMGTKIPDVTKAKGGKSVYKGKTYYFCCPACKPLFDKNPEKYIKQMQKKQAAKPKQQSAKKTK